MATMLRLEKYGRIKFLLWKRASADPNEPKWMRAYAKDSGTVDGTDFRWFFRSWRLFLWRSCFSLKNLPKNVQSKTACIHRYKSIWSIFWHLSLNNVRWEARRDNHNFFSYLDVAGLYITWWIEVIKNKPLHINFRLMPENAPNWYISMYTSSLALYILR